MMNFIHRVVSQLHTIKTKRNDVIKMMYCDYYSQMSYAQFIEFEKQNDVNASYELRETNNSLNNETM